MMLELNGKDLQARLSFLENPGHRRVPGFQEVLVDQSNPPDQNLLGLPETFWTVSVLHHKNQNQNVWFSSYPLTQTAVFPWRSVGSSRALSRTNTMSYRVQKVKQRKLIKMKLLQSSS